MQQPFDVLVVDDSAFMRRIISDFIAEDPMLRVVGTARNGKEAIDLVKKLKPHAVTMDIEMPEMTGLEALRIMMRECPVPVIMLSSLTQEGAIETIKALEWGAVDFVGKPSGSISLDLHKVKRKLLEKLHLAIRSQVKTMSFPFGSAGLQVGQTSPESRKAASQPVQPPKKLQTEKIPGGTTFEHLVAIGTSTGGPKALHQVLAGLPGTLPAPVLIVQHMPPNFTKSLAARLDSISELIVKEAEEGMVLEKGTAYIAPGGYHMTIARQGAVYRIQLNKEEPRGGHRPSVDVLFESLLPIKELKRHIVLMTGMGSDGARGMMALKNSGAITTIAEAEESCIVYGMPRAAIELKCVTHILPQQEIARKLISAVGLSALS